MEEIKAPKKERKFLKAVGNIAKVLANELIMGIGRKFIGKAINKVGNKRQGLVIAFLLVAGISYASIDSIPYPITGNKQRLGFQTSGNGLVWRGLVSDTVTKPTSYADKNVKAYLVLDSVTGSIYVWKQGAWASLVGGGSFTQPVDSLFFDTSVSPNNVDTAKMRWDSELGTVVLGMYDAVPNEIGFKNFWLVKNQTGSTITKGSLVYANGTVGASGRITVAKFIANGSIDAKLLLGITAHDLSNGEDGYVISFGKIRQVNTDTFAAGAILYPSPSVAGVWTDVEPVAPNLDMPIGFCINSSSNNGTIAIRVASGYKLSELHDLAISSPVSNASLYYSGGLWRDTTPTLLVSDTASMLANYATKAYADTTGRLYARQDYTTGVTTSTLTWTQTDTLIPGGVTFIQVYRNGQILLPSQYTVPTSTSVVISASSFKVNDNYTVIFPRGGGAGSGGGSGSLTSISGGTGILVSPNPITTTGTVSADLSVLMELTDTSLLNLTTRFASKLNATDTASLSNRIDTKGSGTVTSIATGYGLSGGTITTSGTLLLDSATVFTRIRDSIVDVAIGNDTIKILKQEYQPALSSVLTWTITPKFPIQLKAYILVFRNGQLLNNDQYNLTDTNKITIVSTSFKVGANYTVATVSGIGSVGSAQAGNPVYPEAGIALSTGSTWASSITNNSANWNTAFTDRLKWDGGSTGLVAVTGRTSLGGTTVGQSMFTLTNPSAITFPRFNVDNSVSALSATDFRTAIGAGVGSGNGTVTSVTVSATSGNPLSILNTTTTPIIELLSATSGRNGYLTSTDWTTFNNKQSALGFTPANSTITIGTTAPLQGGGDLTANRTLSITQATTSADGFLTSTDWNTFNGKQNTLNGTGFVKASGTNITYDNSSYLRTGLADSTYLKLTGGTLTGGLTGTTAEFISASNPQITLSHSGTGQNNILFKSGSNEIFKMGIASNNSSIIFENLPLSQKTSGFKFYSVSGLTQTLGLDQDINGNLGIKSESTPNSLHPNTLYVNGTLGVTGAATLTNLAGSGTRMVTASSTGLLSTQAIPSGGSGTVTGVYAAPPIYVSDNTVSPYITIVDASQFVKGVVNETTQTFGGVKTFANTIKLSSTTGTSTSILGKTSDNSVSTVSVGTGLSLTSGTLSSTITVPTERYVWDLGIFAGAADNSAATWDPQYGLNMLVVPTTLNGYCIDSIYARALTCSTCPPAAGDKDYYIGVYKAGNSTRIQTTGMSLQGSQIAMNEYDLKEVNVNYTLTTGDVWWLYLNGTYTSDMLYITGGFIIKKTCN